MTVLGTAVTLVSAYLALRNVDFAEVWDTLKSSEYWWLLPALAVMALSIVVRVVRWRFLFVRDRRPPFWPLTEALLIGHFFNTVLPARAGDLARVGAINIRAGTSKAEALATVVVERVFDVLALLLLLFVALPWLPEVTWVRTAAIVAVILGIGFAVCVAVLTLYGERPLHFLMKPLGRLPFLSEHRLEHAAANLSTGLMGLRRAHLGGISFLLTLISWLLFALSFWIVTFCFDLGLPFGAGLLVVIATGFSLALPAAPAGIGVFEAATVVALSAYGVPKSEALSYALVLHALNIIPFLVAGGLILNVHGVRHGRRVDSDGGGAGVDEHDVPEPAHGQPDVGDA
jgi:glycosyltransferase 2 family protein